MSWDIPGCPRPGGSVKSQSPRSKMSWDIRGHPSGGSVRSQSPRSKMSWDIRGHPGMSQTWRQCQVPESQVQDILGYPGTSRDIPDCGGSIRSQTPRSNMSWDIPGHPGMSQTWRQCKVPESQVQDVLAHPQCQNGAMFYVPLTVSPQIGKIFMLTNFIYKLYLCEVFMLKFQDVILQTQ